MTLEGSCLCGTVRYEVDQLDMPIGHCHCVTCRKAHAAAYTSTAGVMRDHFRWTAGEEKLSAYESSPSKLRRFCSVCGTHLLAERSAQPHVILRVATLDDDPGTRPAMHIWTSHDAPWLADGKDVPHYPEWPPGRVPSPSDGHDGRPVSAGGRTSTSTNDLAHQIMIRPATPDDMSEVRNLLVATWHDTYDSLLGVERVTETTNLWHALDVLATQAAGPNASFLVATRNGQIVGHAFAVEQDANVLLLSRLYVLPGRQRQGIGEGLLQAAVLRHPGTKRVQLIVEARNTKALAFYSRHGFVVTGEIEEEEPRPLRMEMVVGLEATNR